MLERGATGPSNSQPLDFIWMVTPLGLLKVSVLESLFVCPMIVNTVGPGSTVWVHMVSAVTRVRVAYPVMPVSVESSKGTCHRPESLHSWNLQGYVFIISDGKRPDGVTIMPWKCGRVLMWDVTCPDTYAPSHVGLASREAGLVAAKAEQIKNRKYVELLVSHHFSPSQVECFAQKPSPSFKIWFDA